MNKSLTIVKDIFYRYHNDEPISDDKIGLLKEAILGEKKTGVMMGDVSNNAYPHIGNILNKSIMKFNMSFRNVVSD